VASLWAELKRRNVVRVAIAYLIVSWLVLQLTDVLVSLLTLPDWVGRFVFLLLLIGLPIALFFAWAFEITPDGVKKEKDVDRSQSVTYATGRKLDFVIISVLTIALAFFVIDKYVLESNTDLTVVSQTEIAATEERQSIAVLPFVNMSSDPEQEFFSDGLSEELLNLLARIPELKVIGRTSSFAFKGKNEDQRVIGAALGVNTVLEGSVRKSSDRIRITAQLIDVSDGSHIWSETYDRTMTDVFEIQDSVAAEILNALKIHVGVTPKRGRPTENSEAYMQFLKARALLNHWQIVEAADMLERVVELDSMFAEAYELLSYAYWLNAGTAINSAEGQRLAFDAAGKAIAINPDLMLAQSLYTSANIDTFSFLREIEDIKRVTRLEPGNTAAFDMLVYDLLEAGYMQEALEIAKQFVQVDPLSPAAHLRLYHGLLGVGRIDDAEEALEVFIQLGGEFGSIAKAIQFVFDARDDEAIVHFVDWLTPLGVPSSVARDFIIGGRDSVSGPAFLDEQIPTIVGLVPDEYQHDVRRVVLNFYGYFGHYDRQFEIIFDVDFNESTWTDADDMIFMGSVYRFNGFTAHPKYLEAAELMGIVELWGKRGPPDFCKKIGGDWVCE
jgi:TolB-like protein